MKIFTIQLFISFLTVSVLLILHAVWISATQLSPQCSSRLFAHVAFYPVGEWTTWLSWIKPTVSPSPEMSRVCGCSVLHLTKHDFIQSRNLDFFFYSWLSLGSSPHTTHLLLNFVRGGTLLSASLGCWVVEVLLLCFQIGFHVICLKLDSFYRLSCGGKDPFYCAVVYRPPGPNSTFLMQFSNCLSSTLKLSRLVVFGDFAYWWWLWALC